MSPRETKDESRFVRTGTLGESEPKAKLEVSEIGGDKH